MTLIAFAGFDHFTTHHCVTGSLRHMYAFHGYPISEEMLLGLGAGVGFIYWHIKRTLPFIGGRANVGRPGEQGLEKDAGRCTGVGVELLRTGSAAKAEKTMLARLADGKPVMLVLDMGYLPYFDFGSEAFHFGYHVVVACGYNPETGQVLIADRDEALHPVSLADLAKARGSTYQPFPPRHGWYTFDFSQTRQPEPDEIYLAIQRCAAGMLHPPITNMGVKGIHKAARRIRAWTGELSEKDLRNTCINCAIMIDARGGSGGGLFRKMYGRFLVEAAQFLQQSVLSQVGVQMQQIGERWDQVAELFELAYRAAAPGEKLGEICALLPEIAADEQAVWSQLDQAIYIQGDI